MRHPSLSFVSLLALLAPSASAANVFVVDASGGPGSQFTEIQAAAQAAASGDVILVRSGSYAPVSISAKSLTVIADAGAIVDVRTFIEVRQLAPTQSVQIRGLRVSEPPPPPAGDYSGGLRLFDNAGVVWVEDCIVTGFARCVHAVNSVVNLTRVAATGVNNYPIYTVAGTGIEATNSRLSVDRCSLTAGDAVFNVDGGGPLSAGGAGARLTDTTAFIVASTLKGGKGADGYVGPFMFCAGGADGGPGLSLNGPLTEVHAAASVFEGGAGGAGAVSPFGACPAGQNGANVELNGGDFVPLSLSIPRSLTVSAPKRVGQNVALDFAAATGDLILLWWGPQPGQVSFPVYFHQLLAVPQVAAVLGTMPGPTLTLNVTQGPLPAGQLGQVIYMQAGFLDPLGNGYLGGPSSIIALDPSL